MRKMEPDHYGLPLAKANLESVFKKNGAWRLGPYLRKSTRLPDLDVMILPNDHVPNHPR